eukprot:gene13961-15418_t
MAPKKKKAGGGKGARRTEEDRILYMEQKMLAEEEMKRKKEDMLTQFLKDKLAKEEKSSKFNLNKLQHQWRVIMREAKAQELRKDIEILSQTFERIVDRKDAILKSLVKDSSEADEQYNVALRSHIQNINKLIDFQDSRLVILETEFEQELESIRMEFDTERDCILQQHRLETNEIMDIVFAMDQECEERENEAKQEFQSLRDEIKNKNLEEKHALRIQLEGQVEELWKQFQARKEKLLLKSEGQGREECEEIEMQMRKLQRIQEMISQLRSKMSQNAKECDERNKGLREEREVIASKFHELKNQMNRFRDQQRAQLTTLTLQSNQALQELQQTKEKGERILRQSEICRKLETEEEKVLPFYSSSLTTEEQEHVVEALLEPSTEKLAEIVHEYTPLENFWKRLNKVMLDKLALEKEQQTLQDENQQLRSVLKRYLDGISVNDEILSQTNPLFVVNNRTNVKLAVPVTDPRVRGKPTQTVVEAAHVVSKIL